MSQGFSEAGFQGDNNEPDVVNHPRLTGIEEFAESISVLLLASRAALS